MDLLFNIFILPAEWLMQTILDSIFSLINSYGASLIILSIVINVLILPLHYLAEHLKEQHLKVVDGLQLEIDVLKGNYSGQQRHYYLQTLYKLYDYHPLSSVKASLGLLLQIPFFFAAFHLLGGYDAFNGVSFGPIQDLGQSDKLLFGQNLLPILMTLVNFFSAYIYTKNMGKSDRFQIFGLSIIFLVLLYFESSALLLYWTVNNLFSLARSWIEKRHNVTKFKKNVVNLLVTPVKLITQSRVVKFITKDVFTQSVILLFGTIFVYQAIPLAASDTGMYSTNYTSLVLILVTLLIISIGISLVVYYFLPKKWRQVVTILVTFSALSGLFYAFLIPFEVINIKSLSIPHFFIFEHQWYKWGKVFFIFLLLALWFLIYKKVKNIIWVVLLFSNVVLTIQALAMGSNPKEIDIMINKDNKEMSLKQASEFYAFSKESNTIVILLDAFQGNMFTDIIERDSSLKRQLSGFTYYPNTLSNGGKTWSSIGAILGGGDFQMHLAPKRNAYQKLKKSYKKSEYVPLNEAHLRNVTAAQKYNHSYSIFNPHYVQCSLFDSYTDTICSKRVIFDKALADQKDKILKGVKNSSFETVKFFVNLSWIFSLPHEIKSVMSYYFRDSGKIDQFSQNMYNYSQLQNLAYFANNGSNKKTFKFIHNMISHEAWLINEKCKVSFKKFHGYQGAFNADSCAINLLSSFFRKLKQLGVYDRTKIIITSDHGHHTLTDKVKSKNRQVPETRASALLLVKDFKQSDDLKTSMQFMSNMDVYGISLSGVSGDKEIELDKIKTSNGDRTLIFSRDLLPAGSYNINKAFRVKNNIFHIDNWQELDFEQIQELGR
jgi:YidC/Oxa1 family membrane protein insertase